jgi:beta-glucosidase
MSEPQASPPASAVPALPFWNPDLDLEARVDDLIGRLTLAEKAAQMLHEAPAIPRLGIPAYNWWNEGLHGVARAGVATVFPQAIGLAAMWNASRLHEVAVAISDETRAKHHEYLRHDDHGLYKGLTVWAPNINIFRDPRWGRGHETYGECPYLTARLGVAFCRGLQGDDPRYLKTVATPKHYAVHSGPEHLRHGFDAVVSQKDLRETYLPAFQACITEAKAHSIMSAYNRTNGEPCSASLTLLGRILRGEWGFGGFVVSDCWAIRDIHDNHKVTRTFEESAALAVKAGCDLNCGCTYEHIPGAIAEGLLTEADVDVCLRRLFRARMMLGMFDPPERVSYAAIPYEVNDSEPHRALARAVARESLVLLKNAGGTLPLRRDLKNIAVIGPNAYNHHVLVGNYFGQPSQAVTPLDGIRAAVASTTRVWFAEGCQHRGLKTDGLGRNGNLSEALSAAERADAVVLCLGLSADIEGEEVDTSNPNSAGDKADLALPGLQHRLLEMIAALGKPVVLVVIAGSPLELGWAHDSPQVGAIVQAWYPGAEAGHALADILFGDVSPAGRLPVTFPRLGTDVPPFESYEMKGRTYRYLEKAPLYPFGYGLSYTRFEYGEASVSAARTPAGEIVRVTAVVKNVGTRPSDEVAQLYLTDLEASCTVPHHSLRGFARVHLAPGEYRQLVFDLGPRDLALVDDRGRHILEPGRFRASVGGSQPDARSRELLGTAPVQVEFEIVGERLDLGF